MRSASTDVPADLPPDTVASLRRRLEGHLLSDSPEPTDLLAELFDAVMTTSRWSPA